MHEPKTVGDQLTAFEPLIKYTIKSFLVTLSRKEDSCDYDDYMQEARIAAFNAIKTYNENKKAKLSWYITTVVRNRMVDLTRKVAIPTVKHFDSLEKDSPLDLELERVTTFNPWNNIEFDLSCKQILSKDEYDLYRDNMRYGFSVSQIQRDKKYDNVKFLKSDGRIEGDLRKCLHLIQQKLIYQDKNLTSKKLRKLKRCSITDLSG